MDLETIRAALEAGDTTDVETFLASSAESAGMADSAAAKVAGLEEQVAALTAELQAAKAHNYDLIVAAGPPADDEPDGEPDDEPDGDDDNLDNYL